MKRSFLLLALGFLLTGCIYTPEAEISEPVSTISNTVVQGTSVALEDALAEMYSLMADIGPGTRFAHKSIKSVDLIKGGEFTNSTTRSRSRPVDSLVYLVNFNEGGFAVLAADERLDPVIALASGGRMIRENFTLTVNNVIQPLNIDDLWVEEDEDYLLGGIQPDDSGYFIGNAIINYALRQIINPASTPERPEEPVDPALDGPTYVEEWVVNENATVRKLLETNWHQKSPFNDQCPVMVNLRAPAGCVAIAVMQLMAYYEYPVVDSFNGAGTAVTWNDLRTSTLLPTNLNDAAGARTAAAAIALHAGKGCKTKYDFFGTTQSFATPANAKKYLKGLGYNVNKYNSYYENKIFSEVRAGRPVFIGAMSGAVNGHAWVIDGYMERLKNRIKITSGGIRTIVRTGISKQSLVHCNWGWMGSCDGYYVSKVFDLEKGPEDTDPGEIGGTDSINFSWWFRTVTASR